MAIEDTMVRVNNTGKETFVGAWNSVPYEVKPGQDKMVPYAAMINWLGHPLALNQGPGRMLRQEEFNRLRVQYGAYENDWAWDAQKPTLEAFDLESGDRIVTVVDDPEGENVTAASPSVLENRMLQTQVEQMSKQLDAMQSALADQQNAVASEETGPGVLVDKDEEVPADKEPQVDGAREPGPPIMLDPSDTISGASSDKIPASAAKNSEPSEDTPSKPTISPKG